MSFIPSLSSSFRFFSLSFAHDLCGTLWSPSLISHVTYFLHDKVLSSIPPIPSSSADPQYNRTPCYKEYIPLLSPGGIFTLALPQLLPSLGFP